MTTLCGYTLPLAPEHGARLLLRAVRSLGGPGSGNFGHAGRPGQIGGSGGGENSELSAGDRKLVERWSDTGRLSAREADKLQAIIDRQAPLSTDVIVYRGIPDEDARKSGEKWWVGGQFTSTSRAKHVASRYGDGRVVSIRLPKGTRVLDTQKHGWGGSQEVVLGRETKLRAITDRRWEVRTLGSPDQPRDESGKWTDGSGVGDSSAVAFGQGPFETRFPPISDDPAPGGDFFYHGTSVKNLKAIQAEGIKPQYMNPVSLAPHIDAVLLRIARPDVRLLEHDEEDDYNQNDETAEDATMRTLSPGKLQVYHNGTWYRLPAIKTLGGPGSGNFGHAGRPGEVGGSGGGQRIVAGDIGIGGVTIPDSDNKLTDAVIDELFTKAGLPDEARTVEGAERLFIEKLRAQNPILHHESPGDVSSSIRRRGLTGTEDGAANFAAIGIDSNYVATPEKTVVTFSARAEDIRPDHNYAWSDKLSPEQVLLLKFPNLTGAYVTVGHNIRPRDIISIEVRKTRSAEFNPDQARDESGKWTDGGASGAVQHEALAAQSAVGIAAVEKLLDAAVQNADFSGVETKDATWDDISGNAQDNAYMKFTDNEFGNLDVDTSDLDADFERGLRTDNDKVIEETEKEVLAKLRLKFRDDQPTLLGPYDTLVFDLVRTLDPETLTVGDDDGDGAPLVDLQDLRFTNGDELTNREKGLVQETWVDAYDDNFRQAMDDLRDGSKYQDAVNELQSDAISEAWGNLSDEEKLDWVNSNDRVVERNVSPGLPEKWATGVDSRIPSDHEDYARTRAIALQLVEQRTAQLFEERGIELGPKSSYATSAKTEEERAVVAAFRDRQDRLTQAERLARMTWEEWKDSSTSPVGLALQLAAAKELGGVHRMSASEVAQAEAASSRLTPLGGDGMPMMQAYVRAQWETTQFVMQKAGQEEVQVYRGLMLPKTMIEATPTEQVGAIEGRYGFTKLPDIALQRAGAQSTTGTLSVANNWGGVGAQNIAKPERVVLRIAAPRTSVLSLPVYGQNEQGEHEVVLTGSKDRWSWDAWHKQAPDFDRIPLQAAKLKTLAARKKSKTLVIDLQDLDRGQPHWLRDTPDAVVIRAREKRQKAREDRKTAIKTAARHKETPLHKAADAHLAKLQVAIEYAFARGRKAIGKNANVKAATAAIRAALEDVLAPTLLKVVAAGGVAGLQMLTKQLRAAELRTAKPSKTTVGFKLRFDAKNPAVIAWADKHAAELITGITETTRENINNAVAELQETGDWDEAYDEILAAVGNTARADLIARTETMIAANEGQRQSWDQAVDEGLLTGNEKVAWIVTPIDPCPECEALDGATRDLDGEYPDPGGDGPPLHPNCRCTEGIV